MVPIISIKGISKRYRIGQKEPYYSLRDSIAHVFAPRKKKDEFWALRDVSFDVEKGDIVGIIGRNGAGKSTLLKILSRITPPTRGTITMRGRVASLLEVGTGFNPELTGRENIYLNGAILGMTKREIRRKFDEIVAFSEIGKFLDTPVKRYSSGMYVRLAFSVAAHLEPEILIVDEVLAVGDAQFQKKCIGKMGDVARGGRTVLFVSHNMGAVKQLCSRAVLLEGGTVSGVGDVEYVQKMYGGSSLVTGARFVYPDCTKKAKIREIRIIDKSGDINSEIDINDSFSVEVICVFAETVTKVNRVALTVYDSSDAVAFQTFDVDTYPNYYKNRPAGEYTVTFSLPGGIFNAQSYKMQIDCGVYPTYNEADKNWDYFDRKEDLQVNFFKSNHFTKDFFKGGRPGMFLLEVSSIVKKHD